MKTRPGNHCFSLLLVGTIALSGCSPYAYDKEIGRFGAAVTALGETSDILIGEIDSASSRARELRSLGLPARKTSLSADCIVRVQKTDFCSVNVTDGVDEGLNVEVVDGFISGFEDFKKFQSYVASLQAVANAKDRQEFNTASTSLVQTAAAFSGQAAPLVAPIGRILTLSAGVGLDYRRLRQLRESVDTVDKELKNAKIQLRLVVQQLAEIHYAGEYKRLLALKAAIDKTTDQVLRRELFSLLYQGADRLKALQRQQPEKLVDNLVKSHGELAAALSKPLADPTPLINQVTEFVEAASDVRDAVESR